MFVGSDGLHRVADIRIGKVGLSMRFLST